MHYPGFRYNVSTFHQPAPTALPEPTAIPKSLIQVELDKSTRCSAKQSLPQHEQHIQLKFANIWISALLITLLQKTILFRHKENLVYFVASLHGIKSSTQQPSYTFLQSLIST